MKKVSLFNPESLIIMRFLFVLIFYCSVSTVFGQKDTARSEPGKISFREEAIDSSLLIVDYETVNFPPAPAFFINEKFYPASIMASLGPYHSQSNSLRVVEEDTVINGELYHGKIYITVSDDAFEIKEISLSAIKEKYTELKGQPAVFIIDGQIITRDYDTYLMDENILYTISTGKIKSLDMAYVDILTKTENNIKARNAIHLGIKWKK
jgi:hypothetical protein